MGAVIIIKKNSISFIKKEKKEFIRILVKCY